MGDSQNLEPQFKPTGRHLPNWFLRLAFRLLYNQLAWTYDLVAWLVSFGQWAAWRRTAMLYLQQGSILELAYGTGGLMADMLAHGLSPVGLDLSPYMARLARRRFRRRGLLSRLAQGRAQRLPFPSASFANVVATFPTDFMLDAKTLVAIRRVLRPGGRFVIVVMGYLQGPGPLRRVVEWLYRITGQREIPEPNPLDRLREAGFDARWQKATLNGASALLLVASRLPDSPRKPSSSCDSIRRML